MKSIREEIEQRLRTLMPLELYVQDDSAAHAGHEGAAQHRATTGAVDGTHLTLTVVSNAFADKSLLARHRMIYSLLADLMKTRIHALKIDARAA